MMKVASHFSQGAQQYRWHRDIDRFCRPYPRAHFPRLDNGEGRQVGVLCEAKRRGWRGFHEQEVNKNRFQTQNNALRVFPTTVGLPLQSPDPSK